MFFLLVVSQDSQTVAEDLRGLAARMTAKDYKVVVFFSEDSVELLRADRSELKSLPVGVKMLACRTAVKDHGLNGIENMILGAEMSSFGELVELLDKADRCIFLGNTP